MSKKRIATVIVFTSGVFTAITKSSGWLCIYCVCADWKLKKKQREREKITIKHIRVIITKRNIRGADVSCINSFWVGQKYIFSKLSTFIHRTSQLYSTQWIKTIKFLWKKKEAKMLWANLRIYGLVGSCIQDDWKVSLK